MPLMTRMAAVYSSTNYRRTNGRTRSQDAARSLGARHGDLGKPVLPSPKFHGGALHSRATRIRSRALPFEEFGDEMIRFVELSQGLQDGT